MISLDDVLDKRIKMGRSQIYQFGILSFVDFMDGFAIVFLSILVSLLKAQWGLTQNQVIVLSSSYYFGVAFGKLFQGIYSDIVGRRILLTITMGFMLITLFFHIYIQGFYDVLVLRILFGFEFGITIPLAQVILCEQTPSKFRGRIVSLLQLFFIFGILYLLGSSQIFLENFEEGNWRGLVVFNLFPTFACFIGCLFILQESARFNIIRGRFTEGFKRLNQMGEMNNGKQFEHITQREKDQLVLWSNRVNQSHEGSKSIPDLFKNGRAQITATLWLIMIIWSFQSKGTLMLLPFLYTEAGYGFNTMLIAHSAEIIAVGVAFLLIDLKEVGGRKGTLYLAITLYMLAQLLIFWKREQGVFVGVIIIRFADRLTWICVHQAKLECYSTYYRTFGLGISQFLGFNAAALAPFILFPLFFRDAYLPFLFIGSLSLPLILSVILHPVDATQKQLDDLTILEKVRTP